MRVHYINPDIHQSAIIAAIHQKRGVLRDLEAWVDRSPLIAVKLLAE
jgi:hypothetical protein